jgi:5,10-methylenetetrahydromethanopterin reductase
MDLGFIFVGKERITEIAALAQQAENAGFASAYVAEAWRSAWVPLTAMAAATRRIRLGPYVVNAYGHSPLMTGMAAIDFNEFSGGRLTLGIGGGNRIINEQWQGTPHARVLTKMAEYVAIMRQVARTRPGARVQFSGDVHRMDWPPAVEPDPAPYPVYLAAVFPRMMRIAAQHADGIAAGATLSPDYIREVLKPQAAHAAAAIERDPDGIAWTAVAITAVDADRERARRAAREALCHLYAPLPHPYYEYTMREQGFGTTADALLKLMPAGELEAAVRVIPDECIDRLTIAGTLADCRARLAEYADVLDEVILLNALPSSDGDALSAYATALQLGRPTA